MPLPQRNHTSGRDDLRRVGYGPVLMSDVTWIGAAIVGVMSLGCFYWINELYRASHLVDGHMDRPRFERASSWGLGWMGLWQWSIAAFSGLYGTWSGAIPLLGAGAFLMFAGWFRWRTSDAAQSRRGGDPS
jgi:hypothetical protein